jgi:hypothetical protein
LLDGLIHDPPNSRHEITQDINQSSFKKIKEEKNSVGVIDQSKPG